MADDDQIPVIAHYRGIPIHDGQPEERIRNVVKPSIDHIQALGDLEQLFAYACDISRAPESRLFAAAKCRAIFDVAVEERRARPEIDFDLLRARTAGRDSQYWRSPAHYCTLLDVPAATGMPGAAQREPPLPERAWASQKRACDVEVGE